MLLQVVQISELATREAAVQAALAGMRAEWDSIALVVRSEGENPTVDNLPQLQVRSCLAVLVLHPPIRFQPGSHCSAALVCPAGRPLTVLLLPTTTVPHELMMYVRKPRPHAAARRSWR